MATSCAPDASPVLTRARIARLVWPAAGSALLILVGYLLPFFAAEVTRVTTRYSDGGEVVVQADGLLTGQLFAEQNPHPDAALTAVEVRTERAGSGSSGWAWLVRIGANGRWLRAHASFVVTLTVPVLAALYLLAFCWRARAKSEIPARWIVAGVNLSLLAVACLPVAWAHTFDFSGRVLQAAAGRMAPGAGLAVALVGALLGTWGMWRLRGATRQRLFSWWHLVFAVALLAWGLTKFRPYPYLEIWNFVSDGIVVTLRLVVTSYVFILAVSLLGGLGRISRSPIIYGIASLYVELIRGIPLLVQLLFIWYALPQVLDGLGNALAAISPALQPQAQALIDMRLDPYAAAVLGLTICYGAYGSEIFRAGISSIHRGQVEAARSLGMTSMQSMRYVILPQAVRVILPPVGNEFVALLKDSSLVSVLAVSDLTRRGREYMSRTFLSFDTWILVALCYLVLTLFSSRVVEYIERRSKAER